MLILSSCGNEKKGDSNNAVSQVEQKGSEVVPAVIFENDFASVSKISLEPGDFQPSHDGGKRVIYSLTDYSIDWEEKGEKLGTKTWKKGDAHFHEAGKHAAKNVGASKAEWIVFQTKNAQLPACDENTLENDVISVVPDFAKMIFENDDFRITEVNLPKGENIPKHAGVNRIIYSLSDYQIVYESDSEGQGEHQFKSGDIHWHDACQHALQNIGETDAKFLVVSYKQ